MSNLILNLLDLDFVGYRGLFCVTIRDDIRSDDIIVLLNHLILANPWALMKYMLLNANPTPIPFHQVSGVGGLTALAFVLTLEDPSRLEPGGQTRPRARPSTGPFRGS